MTVEVQDPFNTYTAAPGATVFPYTFKIVSAADLIATIDDIVIDLGIDYSLSGVGSNDGGDLTLLVPLTGGQEVLLKRQMTFDRETDYQQNGDFNAPVVNNDFDRLWLALQQVGQDQLRSIKVPFTETTDQTLNVSPADRANMLLAFDALGNITVVGSSSGDATDLAILLANSVDPSKGASMIGYNGDALRAFLEALRVGTITLAGTKTFTDSPVVPTPTVANQAANKAYVDGRIGRLIGFQVITATGAYLKAINNPSFVIVEVQAGGGGGGGSSVTGSAAGGGGAGGYGLKKILASALAASETVTIGNGGTAGAVGSTGGNGGASTFGAHVSCTGGGGGAGAGSVASFGGGAGGTSSGGDLNCTGNPGGRSIVNSTSGYGASGEGGSSRFGGAGFSVTNGANAPGGAAAINSGSGGGGGSANAGGQLGGAGGSGEIIVWEYA